jgi:hypothetical protein
VDQSNNKMFNSDVAFVPIALFEHVHGRILEARGEAATKAFMTDLIAGNVSQLFYLPPWNHWPNGGVVFLNQIAHTHVTQFHSATAVATFTGYGLERFRERLAHHLLREKDDRLPMSWDPGVFRSHTLA